jgi:hypothetical protein
VLVIQFFHFAELRREAINHEREKSRIPDRQFFAYFIEYKQDSKSDLSAQLAIL